MKASDSICFYLLDILPYVRVFEGDIRRNPESRVTNEQPYWTARGHVHIAYGKWDSVFFDGRDTMKECAKRGITLVYDGHRRYDVFAK